MRVLGKGNPSGVGGRKVVHLTKQESIKEYLLIKKRGGLRAFPKQQTVRNKVK